MRESQDQLARNAMLAGASVYTMTGGVNGRYSCRSKIFFN